ncbi:transposase [Citrobacter sp. FP75]|uniref:transposase n=1 Tax=Citrobacter sp. FP75 TaxID=1852949 RepID=UPI001BC90584|nr:transposase [Citrobacter sp. FP75]
MAKTRFTAEQIADFLQQSKSGVPNKILCEKYEFSVSTLRRWQDQHAEGIRRELKKLESTGSIVFLCFFISALLLAIIFSKLLSACVMFFFLVYCVDYIRKFRKISAKHIQEENIFLSRSGRGASNAFYHFCWAFIALFILGAGYLIVRMV